MALPKPKIDLLDDGTLHYKFPPGTHVVATGPITGEVTLDDGTVYNVTPHYVAVRDKAHQAEVMHRIGLRYAAEGHPHADTFIYTPPKKG